MAWHQPGDDCFMLVSLLVALSWLHTSFLSSMEPPSFQKDLTADALGMVCSQLGFGDLYDARGTSKYFQQVANPILFAQYGVRVGNKVYLDNTRMLNRLDDLVRAASRSGDGEGRAQILSASKEYQLTKASLEDVFGYCIEKEGPEVLPKFRLEYVSFAILNDERRVSVLPYLLNHQLRG